MTRSLRFTEPVEIPMEAEFVTDTRLASTISRGGAKVQTVEHIMSACAGLGIDNLYIDITADEVPILDGSASSFVYLLQSAGIELHELAPQAASLEEAFMELTSADVEYRAA